MSELIEGENVDNVSNNEAGNSPGRSLVSCDTPRSNPNSTSARLQALEVQLSRVLDVMGSFVQGTGSSLVPPEREGRGEGSSKDSKASSRVQRPSSGHRRLAPSATISKRPRSPSPPTSGSRPRVTDVVVATPSPSVVSLPTRYATSEVRRRDFVPPKGRDFFAPLKPISKTVVSRDRSLQAPVVTRGSAGPAIVSSGALSAAAVARASRNVATWVAASPAVVAPQFQARSQTSSVNFNSEEEVPLSKRLRFQPVLDLTHEILPSQVVKPPPPKEGPFGSHPLFEERKAGPIPFSLSSDLTTPDSFMAPVNEAVQSLTGKGNFLLSHKKAGFPCHNFPFSRASEGEPSNFLAPVPKEEARFLRVQEDLTLTSLQSQQSLQVLLLSLEQRLKREGNEVSTDVFTHIAALKEAVWPLGESLSRILANDRLRRRDIQLSDQITGKVASKLRTLPVFDKSVFPTEVTAFVEEQTRHERSLDQGRAIAELLKVARKAPAPPPHRLRRNLRRLSSRRSRIGGSRDRGAKVEAEVEDPVEIHGVFTRRPPNPRRSDWNHFR